jgi:hypothetical protein
VGAQGARGHAHYLKHVLDLRLRLDAPVRQHYLALRLFLFSHRGVLARNWSAHIKSHIASIALSSRPGFISAGCFRRSAVSIISFVAPPCPVAKSFKVDTGTHSKVHDCPNVSQIAARKLDHNWHCSV